MYFSCNDADKTLYRANLETGEVEVIGNLKLDGPQKVEGLAIKHTKDGWTLNVLNREESQENPGTEAVGFYEYLRPYGNALSGEIHADINGAFIEDSRFVRDAASRRIRSAFDAVATPSSATVAVDGNGLQAAPADTDGMVIWSEALASTGDVNGSGDAADFSRNTAGFVGGVDAPVGNWRLGMLAGYSHSTFDASDRARPALATITISASMPARNGCARFPHRRLLWLA